MANFGWQLLHLIKQKSSEQIETSDAWFADTEPSWTPPSKSFCSVPILSNLSLSTHFKGAITLVECLIAFNVFFPSSVMFGIEPRASGIWGKQPTTELQTLPDSLTKSHVNHNIFTLFSYSQIHREENNMYSCAREFFLPVKMLFKILRTLLWSLTDFSNTIPCALVWTQGQPD